MSRNIRVGDIVQAFLNANIKGEVINFGSTTNRKWTVGGTLNSNEPVCNVKLTSTGEVVTVKVSDLFIVKY